MAPQREWFEKDYYSVLGVPDGATRRRSRARTASSRSSTTPTRTRGTPRPRSGSRRSRPPTTCSATRRSARSTTRSGAWSRRASGRAVRRRWFGPAGSAGSGGGFQNVQFDVDDVGGLGDLLGGLFGRGGAGRRSAGPRRSRAGPRRGDDLETELHLDFLDAVHGVTTSVCFTAEAVCSVCHGTGAEPGTFPETCPDCAGSGAIAVDQGPFSFSQVCPTCGGSGPIVKDKCPKCRGRGVEVAAAR